MLGSGDLATRRVEDEELAGRCTATLLITATTPDEVESLARRIHFASARAAAPFVVLQLDALPSGPSPVRAQCSSLFEAATGGSLLVNAVDELPVPVQEILFELLPKTHSGPAHSAAIRLIAGTTVSLFDRVSIGAFSERLFYRLNVIHLTMATEVV